MKKKPLLIVTRKCMNCLGEGKTFDTGGGGSGYEGDLGGCDQRITCPSCNGKGYKKVYSNEPDFINLYIKSLENRIDKLTKELRSLRSKAGDKADELRKYCKELDKVINKK